MALEVGPSLSRSTHTFLRLVLERFPAGPRFRLVVARLLEDKSYRRESILMPDLLDRPDLHLGGLESLKERSSIIILAAVFVQKTNLWVLLLRVQSGLFIRLLLAKLRPELISLQVFLNT
mgnify:CR=1 FL=1